jgi:ferredoxin-NADP reductase/anaerobic selenocysteine-containing dehydrogenase
MAERSINHGHLPVIEHAGVLEDLGEIPGCLLSTGGGANARSGFRSCSFCGVGDSGVLVTKRAELPPAEEAIDSADGDLEVEWLGKTVRLKAKILGDGLFQVLSSVPLTERSGVLSGKFSAGNKTFPVSWREEARAVDAYTIQHTFRALRATAAVTESKIEDMSPTGGCVKFRISMMRQRPAFPVHIGPSVLDRDKGTRRAITYEQGIAYFADLLLAHRAPTGKTLIYGCGQIDYFTVFAMQEVFRLLGIRNLTGNAEHCLNAGAVHNEILTGQEGPFVTIAQAFEGPDRFYLLNGWNGFITHPPAFAMILKRPDADVFLFEVMETESAKAIAMKFGEDRVILIRPASDPHIALAVANEILNEHPDAVNMRFVDRFADRESFEQYAALARSEMFAPARVAERTAAEPKYVERVLKGIRMVAHKLAQPSLAPVNIPSVGLSQTSGVVAHCLWGSAMALVGKYGLAPDGRLLGGTLRLPGQINAESEVQGLSRKYFMGRVPMEKAADAARRMGLPDDAYEQVIMDAPRAALDYSDPNPDQNELIICFGTQFESNMMERPRWIEKLTNARTKLVVIDPIPDPFTLDEADLVMPSPPHPATPKVYQNGEWRLSLSIPQKRAPKETRSDATIIYDVMAEVARRLESDATLGGAHPDLVRHLRSGYLKGRFGEGLLRVGGEVSRSHLWARVIDYMSGGSGPLYCRPDHADGTPIAWDELLERGSLIYGGVGVNRYVLDYEKPGHEPFNDVFRHPCKFRFFTPKNEDLTIPQGVLLNSGRSTLSDDPARIRFATSTFNSGKATPIVDMPAENPIYVSLSLAERLNIKTGHAVRVFGGDSQSCITLPAVVSDRVKGDTAFVSFHKNKAEIEEGRYLNTVTSHVGRCAYSSQTRVKATAVRLEPVAANLRGATRIDTTTIDPNDELPVWQRESTPLHITEVIQETHDVYTYRLQGDPLCHFRYLPGQFCSVVLNIDGKKVVRSYSISSTPTRPFILEITVKRVPGGLASNWMADNLKPGAVLHVSGPKGRFTLIPGRVPRKLLFLGAGSGLTPLMSMARWLCDLGADVDVKFFNSVRSPNDIIFRKELELLTSRHCIFAPIIISSTRTTGQEWMGLEGRISRHVLDLAVPDIHERHIYMCGPNGFMESAKSILSQMEFDPAKIHLESFGGARTPSSSGLEPADDAEAKKFEITFARTGKVAFASGSTNLLEFIEVQDVDINYGCRSGSCGDCKVRVLKGDVTMSCDDGLDAEDKANGYVLSCVATLKSDCTLDI